MGHRVAHAREKMLPPRVVHGKETSSPILSLSREVGGEMGTVETQVQSAKVGILGRWHSKLTIKNI